MEFPYRTRHYDHENLILRKNTPILVRRIPKDKNVRTIFVLTLVDSHPGLRRPAEIILKASHREGKLLDQATIHYSAMAEHRIKYVKYVIQEVENF